MIDIETAQSPGWWLKVMARELHTRRFSPQWSSTTWDRRRLRPPLELLEDYMRGDPPLPSVAEGWQQGVRAFLRLARMNYALLCVQSVQHRLRPLAFGTAADDDRDGDQQAAAIYGANDLDLRFANTGEFMLGMGDGYMIVGPPPQGQDEPLITSEDPRQVITSEDPATGRTIAALKMFRDEWGARDTAYVYLPGRVYVAHRPSTTSAISSAAFRFDPKGWTWDESAGGVDGMALPTTLGGRIPVVRFANARGVGEFEPHLAVLDRINDQIFDRIVTSKYQAFRQRGIEGLPDAHPVTGEAMDYSDAFLADPGGLWRLPAGAKIWESQLGDLSPMRMSIKDDVEAFAAVTFTPLHYITPDAAQGSAEGASVMREGHLFRVDDRRRRSDVGLGNVLSLAFAWKGDTERANRSKIRTLWQPAERHSLTEKMSAASQAKASGLPQSSVWTDVMGYSPTEIPRLEQERARDLLFLQAPLVAPASGGKSSAA